MTEPSPSEPLGPDAPIPEFAASTASGKPFGRTDLLGRPTILFFYPKANSPGCSLEAREFARHRPELEAAGWTIVGVSVDPPEAQSRFQERCELPFELLSDRDRSVSRAFGVLGGLGRSRRTTFLIRADGTVAEVLRSWNPRRHVALALARAASPPPREPPANP
jgi:thioredoxin-dependent peroxiredoxin